MIIVIVKKQVSELSLLTAVNYDWSQVMPFDFNQLKNLKLSLFLRNPIPFRSTASIFPK